MNSKKIQLPSYMFISENDYYNFVDSKNYLGLARIEGFNQLALTDQDRIIYVQFDTNNVDLINKCITEILNTYYSYWKSYSKEIRTNNNTENN
jgi:hypothetical protein